MTNYSPAEKKAMIEREAQYCLSLAEIERKLPFAKTFFSNQKDEKGKAWKESVKGLLGSKRKPQPSPQPEKPQPEAGKPKPVS